MSEEQTHNAESSAPESENSKRRRRRGNRGGRGRRRSPIAAAEGTASGQEQATDDIANERASAEDETVAQNEERDEVRPETPVESATPEQEEKHVIEKGRPSHTHQPPQRPNPRSQPPRQPTKPATPEQISSAVGEAIEDVYRITETLKRVLDDLDELLETLELAERQKLEDERELDTLRRAMRQVTQRPQLQQQRPQQPQHRSPQRPPDRPPERHRQAAPRPEPEAMEQSPADDDVPPQS
jgi:hypothetical protein